MLSKLLKHDFKASGRILLPIYAATIIMGILSSLFIKVPTGSYHGINVLQVVQMLFVILYIFILIAELILSFIISIYRFKRNYFDSEGYLMNTLPVKTGSLITSKVIVAVVYQIIGCVIAMLSGLIMMIFNVDFSEIHFIYVLKVIGQIFEKFGDVIVVYTIEGIMFMILSMMCANLTIFASIGIGHSFNSRKVLKSVGAYIGIYFVTQIINLFIVKCASLSNIFNIYPGKPYSAQPVAIGLIIMEALYVVAFFALTRYFMKNKLNLQ